MRGAEGTYEPPRASSPFGGTGRWADEHEAASTESRIGCHDAYPRDTDSVSIGTSWLWCLAGCLTFWWLVAYVVEQVM